MSSAFKSSRKLNRSSRQVSNAGFSLVELLIAVVILSIIVIPFLHMFVTTTRINVKSRQMLRATTVAQDIMEGLKAYTLEEVRAQFTPPEGTSGSDFFIPTEGFYVINTKMIEGGVREIVELEKDDPDDPDNEIYYFGIEKVKMQGGEYDALIRLDASTYTEAKVGDMDGSGPAADAHDNAYNGSFYAEIGSVAETSGGSETDSSYHESKELSKAVLTDIKKNIESIVDADDSKELPDNWDEKRLGDFVTKRAIDVVIEDAGELDADGNPMCRATITFTYTYTYDSVTYTSNGYIGSAAGEVKGITRTFSSGNFYLFYYPYYPEDGESGFEDAITFKINNAAKLTDPDAPMLKNITLAKQIRSDILASEGLIVPELTDAKLNAAENRYLADVRVTSDVALNSKLNFKTNVQTNMSNAGKTVDSDTGEVEWGTLPSSNVRVSSPDSNVNIIDMIGTNVSDKVTNVIYDIEIQVFETGAAEHFTEPDFVGNSETHRLARITNLNMD